VSIPLVAEARDLLERRERGKRHPNGGGTATLSDDAVERIWRAVDRFTQPQLPLAAAE
jgi:hypothetical protein